MALKVILGILFFNFSTAVEMPRFILNSPSFDDKTFLPLKHVYNQFGCKGKNDSPSLEWTDGPEGTKSYAVTIFDPDSPSGSGWWQWVVFNIPITSTELKEGVSNFPKGAVQARNDYGASHYGGPCPTINNQTHRIIITVYALKIEKIPLDLNASGAMVGFYINQNKLAQASLTAYYKR